jgi:2-oxoglutarate dehydrogenase E2 component (dihydrolipoamide succinyltransferase)
MIYEVRVPAVGESIKSGILVEWLKGDSELVKKDEPLYVLETDKVTLTLNADYTGWLTKKVKEGEEVLIGQVVAVIDTSAEKGPPMIVSTDSEQSSNESLPELPEENVPKETPPTSPFVRKIIDESGIDINQIKGSGKDGRVTVDDVKTVMMKKEERERIFEDKKRDEKSSSGDVKNERQTRRKVSPIRARISERLLMSLSETAQLTTFDEADLTELYNLREKVKEKFKSKYNFNLTYLPFVVMAVVRALKEVRQLATFLVEDELVENNYFDIGIAVSAEQGLVVPVLRDADKKDIVTLQREIFTLSSKVREKKITLEELQGGVFSITNPGSYGALFGTPILNPPQSGILGIYAIEDRPKVVEGRIEIRKLCYLALTYDHRVVDGKEASTFLKIVKDYLEKPSLHLLEV